MSRRILLLLLLAGWVGAAWPGEGHDHGDAEPVVNTGGPSRLPDGSVHLPKPAQRQLAIRTALTSAGTLARTVELAGRVVMDPNAGGRVQAISAGRLEPGPAGLPVLGQRVRKGELLAYVMSSAAPIERSTQAAQLAEIRASQALASKRLARLRELSDTVPRKEIEAVESEIASLAARATAIGGGLTAREALVAPVSGVIASSLAVAGQVLDARELVYEIVDPTRLDVEALAFDAALAGEIEGAVLALGNDRVPLDFIGAGRALREQALPLLFRPREPVLGALAVGQPVRVFAQLRGRIAGIALPAAALMRNPSNQSIVWVKTAPESFSPQVVVTEPLDGVTVAVTNGLAPGSRIAVQGAQLINQIR